MNLYTYGGNLVTSNLRYLTYPNSNPSPFMIDICWFVESHTCLPYCSDTKIRLYKDAAHSAEYDI